MSKNYLEEKFDFDDIKYLSLELPDAVKFYKFSGNFEKEILVIDKLLSENLPMSLKKRLYLERIIATDMCENYSISREDAFRELKKEFPLLCKENANYIMNSGHVDFIVKGGKIFLEDDALSNIKNELYEYLYPLNHNGEKMPKARPSLRKIISEKMIATGSCSYKFTIKEHLRLHKNALRDSNLLVHLPYPIESSCQKDITLIDSSHPIYISSSPQRTASVSLSSYKGEDINITFSFISKQFYHNPNYSDASFSQPNFYINEQYPHIKFTQTLINLAKEIAKDEKNPLLLAKMVYDYVTENTKYSYLRSYRCIDNLPEFTYLNGRGDCGSMALLFITLCRILKIPAKWESGKSINENYIGMHDWAMFYVEPFGWLRTDLSSGADAVAKKDYTLADFYFCNVDPLRMAANSEFQMQFTPTKQFLRCDPYDNQCGEAEYSDMGLGYSSFDTNSELLEMKEIY